MPLPDVITVDSGEAPTQNHTVRGHRVLASLGLLTLASIALFLTYGVDGQWDFALPRRLEQVVALTVVGTAVAISTVIFHTLTENHILTPSIMGFDTLYVLMATVIVFVFGATAFLDLPDLPLFLGNATMLVVAATLLYRWVLGDGTRGLYTLVLVGVIAATLFGSITQFMFRIMEPNEFDVLLTSLFATFNDIDTGVLGIASMMLIVGIFAAYRMIHTLDVLTLGRDRAITLGIEYRPVVTRLLIIVATLVAVSTALVGPITFLGLLVANLAYRLTRTQRHITTFPAAALISIAALVLGQWFLQHVLTYTGTLSSIINVVGGVYFVVLLVRQSRQ